MTVIIDDLRNDRGWEGTYAGNDGSSSVANNALTVTRGTGYHTSAQGLPSMGSKNVLLRATVDTYVKQPVFVLQQTDSSNLIFVWLSAGDLKISSRLSGSTTHVSTTAIPDATNAEPYTLEIVHWNDRVHVTVIDQNDIVKLVVPVTSQAYFGAMSAGKAGFSMVTAGTIDITDVTYISLNQHVNIVSIGDSNTKFSLLGYEQCFPRKMQVRKVNEGFTVINSGIGGDTVQEMNTRFTTDVLDYKVDTARNICTILAGTNNSSSDTAAATWAVIETMKDAAIADGWEVIISTYPKAGSVYPGKVAFLDDLNALIIANEATGGYTVVDLHGYMGCSIGSSYVNPDLVFVGNELHLNETAHAGYAKLLLESFTQVGRSSVT